LTPLIYITLTTVVAYLLFFLYDWLEAGRPEGGSPAVLFGSACALVVAATVILLVHALPSCPWDLLSVVALVLALVFAGLMVKALFFSLPADTYRAPRQGRSTCTRGMYALCRHPGVLWYSLMFVSLALMLRSSLAAAGCALLIAGDVAYMLFQDAWSFPRIFCDYDAYRRSVPLFLPTRASIRAAFDTRGCAVDGGRA